MKGHAHFCIAGGMLVRLELYLVPVALAHAWEMANICCWVLLSYFLQQIFKCEKH
jgi:hypothetical protein